MVLKKTLTTAGVFSLGAGAMVSSGLFILPAIAFSVAGRWVLISYALAGVFMIPALLTKLELTTAMPKAGGAFFYLTRIFGAPVGTVAGLADWFSIALKSAFALVGIGVFGSLLFPEFGETEFKIIAIVATVVFTALNIVSVEGTGRFQVFMVGFLLTVLAFYVLAGYREMNFTHFTGEDSFDLYRVIATTGMVFISYGGITKIAAAVEEVKDPRKMLVPGILSAFFVVQAFYLLVVFVTVGAMEPEVLRASVSPLTDAAFGFFSSTAMSRIAVILVAVAGILSFFTTANAGILSASRAPMAMSKDGLLPPVFGRISGRGSPVAAILATSAFIIIIIAGLDIEELAKVASLFLLLVFFLESLGLIIARYSGVANYQPFFRAPLFPVLQILGLLVYGTLIVSQGAVPLAIAAGFSLLGLVWYFVYGRSGWSRTCAFVATLGRVSGPELSDREMDLEDELMSVLLERDAITPDRFDSIIRNAPFFDYDHTINADTLFDDVSKVLAEKYNLDPAPLKEKFLTRERTTSTLLYPGVAVPHAIPHIVVPGESIFDIVLVRNRYGIEWHDGNVVYTSFCLIGSKDERNFHLRALMAIAQMLQDGEFRKKWHESGNERELRSAVLLARRQRHGDHPDSRPEGDKDEAQADGPDSQVS
ncbi:MAG: amino acid permease, partial [Spirochaetia bacterium]